MFLETRDIDYYFYMVFWIVQDENSTELARNVETIWDVMADAGGFYEVVSLISLSFIFHFQNFSYVS